MLRISASTFLFLVTSPASRIANFPFVSCNYNASLLSLSGHKRVSLVFRCFGYAESRMFCQVQRITICKEVVFVSLVEIGFLKYISGPTPLANSLPSLENIRFITLPSRLHGFSSYKENIFPSGDCYFAHLTPQVLQRSTVPLGMNPTSKLHTVTSHWFGGCV